MAGFLFDGHVRNISNIDYSIYATFTISAALELPADLLSIPCIDHIGRRWRDHSHRTSANKSIPFGCTIRHLLY